VFRTEALLAPLCRTFMGVFLLDEGTWTGEAMNAKPGALRAIVDGVVTGAWT